MTVKQWLLRARKISDEIDALEEAREEMFTRLTSGTASLDGDGVAATKDPHKLDRYAELCSTIDERINDLTGTKIEILAAIEKVQEPQYRVLLIERYITGKTWEQIAVDMNYSYRGVTKMHGRALDAMKECIEVPMA